MGLDASVRCRCWEDGLCSPPPSLAVRLRYDPETAKVSQVMPEGLSLEEVMTFHLEYELWMMEHACVHEDMRIASERISNWAGLREFQHALHIMGEDACANLQRQIPDFNGGLTGPADAQRCLVELEYFCSTTSFGETVELIAGDMGEVLHSRVAPYAGWLSTNSATGISCRLTADGTFQIESGPAGLMQHDPRV